MRIVNAYCRRSTSSPDFPALSWLLAPSIEAYKGVFKSREVIEAPPEPRSGSFPTPHFQGTPPGLLRPHNDYSAKDG
jgi:hypothetical protein